MADDDAQLDRQQQIWAGLYGPARAAELVDEARARRRADPSLDLATIVRSLEPVDDDDDPDEAGTMRPGVG